MLTGSLFQSSTVFITYEDLYKVVFLPLNGLGLLAYTGQGCQFHLGPGLANIAHLRMGLSSLKSHLFHHGLSDSNICEQCNEEIDDNWHFMLRCDKYTNKRQEMLVELCCIVPINEWRYKSEKSCISAPTGQNFLPLESDKRTCTCIF